MSAWMTAGEIAARWVRVTPQRVVQMISLLGIAGSLNHRRDPGPEWSPAAVGLIERELKSRGYRRTDSTETETVEDFRVICPWCGVEMSCEWELGLDDGDSTETDCGACERPFHVSASVCVTYTAARLEGPMTEREAADRVARGSS